MPAKKKERSTGSKKPGKRLSIPNASLLCEKYQELHLTCGQSCHHVAASTRMTQVWIDSGKETTQGLLAMDADARQVSIAPYAFSIRVARLHPQACGRACNTSSTELVA